MNNTVLKIVAALLALGAVIVGIMGVRLSKQPPATPPAPVMSAASAPREAVLVAAHAIKSGQVIRVSDVTTQAIESPPATVIRDNSDILGKVAKVDVAAGAPLLSSQFMADSLASILHKNERAVAIQIDEINSVGGYIKPGDRVDVLFYQASNKENGDTTSAQVAVQDVRLLSVGDVSAIDAAEDKVDPSPTKDVLPVTSKNSKTNRDIKDRRQGMKSAVLAVDENEVTKLMLAASSGQLRLALRPQQADTLSQVVLPASTNAAAATHFNRRLITIADIAPGGKKSRPAAGPTEGGQIIIQEGSKERRLATTSPNIIQP